MSVRAVYEVNKASMEIVEEYPSQIDCSIATGINYGALYYKLVRRGVSDGMIIYRYADDYDKNDTFDGKFYRKIELTDVKTGKKYGLRISLRVAEIFGAEKSWVTQCAKGEHVFLGRFTVRYAR